MLSKNTSVVAWFIMVRIGRMVRPLSLTARMSTRNTDSPSVRFFDLLARRGAREQQHQVGMLGARGPDLLAVDDVVALPSRTAVVRRLSVSVPEVGSVTPNACSRSSPLAMPGR